MYNLRNYLPFSCERESVLIPLHLFLFQFEGFRLLTRADTLAHRKKVVRQGILQSVTGHRNRQEGHILEEEKYIPYFPHKQTSTECPWLMASGWMKRPSLSISLSDSLCTSLAALTLSLLPRSSEMNGWQRNGGNIQQPDSSALVTPFTLVWVCHRGRAVIDWVHAFCAVA